jgi:hypothetical protein
MSEWVYKRTETTLWTVGYYTPSSKWEPESDHGSPAWAGDRVHYLNGGCDRSCAPTRKEDSDPISRDLKTVAIAVFGEKMAAKTVAANVATENIAGAIAAAFWPGDDDQQRALRRRFVDMCVNKPVLAQS